MKKTIIMLAIIGIIMIGTILYFNSRKTTNNDAGQQTQLESNQEEESNLTKGGKTMKIRVTNQENTIIYELNNSLAAQNLYNQLPIITEVENYSNNEKIFYPNETLDTTDTPLAKRGGEGVLAYYEPWNDIVMFYDNFSSNSSLYELGKAVEGSNNIKNLSGEITIEVE